MRLISLFLLAGVGAAAAAACYVGPIEKSETPTVDPSPTEPEPEGEGTSDDSSAVPDEGVGLPCEVDTLLKARCQSCHGSPPKKAPMALVTYEDLTAKATSDDTQTVAEVSLARMKSSDDPMPPGSTPKATAAEIKAFTKWIADDFPRGSCATTTTDAGKTSKPDAGKTSKPDASTGTDAATPPADAGFTSVCTSGMTWTSSEKGSKMNPGRACISCHTNVAGDPLLQVAGTVYPTLHEPDKCYGVQSASVVVTDATGRKVTITTGATGNFTLSTAALPLVYPLKVKVVKNGLERAMVSAAPHGDCNGCHTEAGKNGAPGRILLP